MSLMIDVDLVEAVLLADGWHEVADASFSFHDRTDMLVSGPLTAIQAVRHRRS